MQHREKLKIVTADWIVDCIKSSKLLPEAEYEPVVVPQRSPLKAFNSHKSVMQGTPKMANSTQPSAFMTPVTPSQTLTTSSPVQAAPNTEKSSENKENVGVLSLANSGNRQYPLEGNQGSDQGCV